MRIGIQGGRGSFNEQALAARLNAAGSEIADYEVFYLYTTARVLEALSEDRIDQGQFAVFNTLGGDVVETRLAKERFSFDQQFETEGIFQLQIAHCLMAAPGVLLSEITTVLTHPQVIAQCRKTFAERFPQLQLVEGTGDFADPARIGQALSQGELPPTTATASSERIAKIFGLSVLATNLQDRSDNYTHFELARRRKGA